MPNPRIPHIPVEVPYQMVTGYLEPASPYGELILHPPEGMVVVDAHLEGPVSFFEVGVIYDNDNYNIRYAAGGAEFRCAPTADPATAILICISVTPVGV